MGTVGAGQVGAVLLVGGRSRRMGGGYKPQLLVGGRSMFDRAVGALSDAGCAPIMAAGPVLDAAAPVHWVREDPPYTGPVAAIGAALEGVPATHPEWMMLLAG